MNAKKSWTAFLLILVATGSLLLTQGCHKSTPSSEIKPPTKKWWGKAGEQPTKVWADYEWVIMSRDEYEGKCR